MPTEPQPRRDKQDVPYCQSTCPHYKPASDFWGPQCRFKVEGLRIVLTREGSLCLPAVRAMAAELRELKEQQEFRQQAARAILTEGAGVVAKAYEDD